MTGSFIAPHEYLIMMNRDQTKDQLLDELDKLREQISEMDRVEIEHRQKEQALLDEKYFTDSIINSLPGIFYFFDRKGKFLKWNRNFETVTEYSGEEISAMSPLDYFEGSDKEQIAKKIQDVFTKGEDTTEAMLVSKSGKKTPYFFSGKRITVNGASYLAGMGVDITAQKNMEKQLHMISITDDLTGLLNRRGFFTFAEKQCEIAGRNNLNLSFLFIDLDGMKAINDSYGHKTGDMALSDTAKMLKMSFRTSDIISRFGGDEFVVIVMETPETNIETLTNRLKSNVDRHNRKENKPYTLSFSLGLTQYDHRNPCSVDELISNADKLMYEQKKNRKP